MILIPTEPTKPEIVTTIEGNLASRLAYLSQAPQAELHHGEQISYFRTNIAYPNYLFNIVHQSRFKTVEDIYYNIDEVLTDAQQRQAPVFWSVPPSAQPTGLGLYLEANKL